MRHFDYLAPATVDEAVGALTTIPGARLLGGGTNLIDLIRQRIESPELLVDVTRVKELTEISERPDGGLRV